MQKLTFTCKHCHRTIPANPCLKGIQEYCGDQSCQNARKNSWATHKRATDKFFVQRQHQAQKQWYQNKPGNLYYNQYRQLHPDCVLHNREQQKERNHQRRCARLNNGPPPGVKTDVPQNPPAGIYRMKILTLPGPKGVLTPDSLRVILSPDTGADFKWRFDGG
ncbi:hypothetical protein L0128_17355 [candidate division KSB1 bacterium]|nr:hypothetical protein [candidate division KSB1 bacterium]